jgi:hypothetical protein
MRSRDAFLCLAILFGVGAASMSGCRSNERTSSADSPVRPPPPSPPVSIEPSRAAAVTPTPAAQADAGIATTSATAAPAAPESTSAARAWITALSASDIEKTIAASEYPFFLELRDMDAAARCPTGKLADATALRAALECLIGSRDVGEILASQDQPPEVGAASPGFEVTRQEKPSFPADWIERHGHAAVRVGPMSTTWTESSPPGRTRTV